jgi:hypothetical protein
MYSAFRIPKSAIETAFSVQPSAFFPTAGNEVAGFQSNEVWMNSFHHWFRPSSRQRRSGCWTTPIRGT